MRIVLFAALSLAATTLPLSAQTPSGPVQGAVQGTVKGTATVGQGIVQGLDKLARGLRRDRPASREAPDKRQSVLLGALAPWPQKPAEALGVS